jgi:signal transduction histidine kinase
MSYFSTPSVIRSAVAVASVAVALTATWMLPPMEQIHSVFLLAAVAVSTWYGGLAAGLLATALSAVALAYLLSPSAYLPGDALGVGMEIGAFVLTAVLIGSLHAAQRRLEEKLRLRDRRRGEFLAVLAHELRNCLSPIPTLFHVLQAPEADTAFVERSREMVQRQFANMTRLVNDLLDLSRIDQGKVRLNKVPVDLLGIVAHAVETASSAVEARGHRLEVSRPPAPVWVEADPMRLEHVLVNLVTNAAKFTEPGGRIGIAVEPVKGEVRIRVRDTGRGFPSNMLPRLFDLFAQEENGSRGGLGVGLNLAHGLVRLHGGDLTAHSDGPGRGSEFIIRLPVAERVANEDKSGSAQGCLEVCA